MTGINKDELMQISRESGLEFCEEECAHSVYVSLAQFTNAILERAAEELDSVEAQKSTAVAAWIHTSPSDAVRALKINTGD